MGMRTRDGDGNIITQTPAQFTIEETGSCIAVGSIDPETHEINQPVSTIYGDWDAAGYLGAALQMLPPSRAINIPDLKSIILALERDNVDCCDYCEDAGYKCRDCIVSQWRSE